MNWQALSFWDGRGPAMMRVVVVWSLVQSIVLAAPTATPQPQQKSAPPEGQAGGVPTTDNLETEDPRQVILSAKTVSIVSILVPAEAQKAAEAVALRWGRYTLVPDPAQADLVLQIVEIPREVEVRGRVQYRDSDETWGMVTEKQLMDRLRVFKGGKLPDPLTIPLWDSGEIRPGRGLTAVRAIKRFRKFVQALEKKGKR